MNKVSEIERKKIISILGYNCDMMSIVKAKLYTAGKNSDEWLYSDSQGFLCYVVDYSEKARYLILYDLDNFEIIFKMKIYKDFINYFFILSENFLCFETNNGFVGFQISNKEDLVNLSNVAHKFDDEILNQLSKATKNRKRDKYLIGLDNISILKDTFMQENKYTLDNQNNINNIEDSLELSKPSLYSNILDLSFDNEGYFDISKMSKDIKTIIKNSGLKKSDFKNMNITLSFIKDLISTFDNIEQKRKATYKQIFNNKRDTNKLNLKSDNLQQNNISQYNNIISEDSKNKTSNLVNNTNASSSNNNKNNIPQVPLIPLVPKVPLVPLIPAVPQVYKY